MRHTDIRWKLLLVLLCCLLLTACGGSMQGADSQEMSGRREDIPLSDIPEYTGEPYIAVDGNEPDFSEEERTANAFESYSELDSLGR